MPFVPFDDYQPDSVSRRHRTVLLLPLGYDSRTDSYVWGRSGGIRDSRERLRAQLLNKSEMEKNYTLESWSGRRPWACRPID